MYLDGFMTRAKPVTERHNLHRVGPELRDVGVLIEAVDPLPKEALLEVRHHPAADFVERASPGAGPGAPGPVGLREQMVLVNAGYETYIYSRSPKPNAKAVVGEAIGAKYISSQQTPVERMAEQVGNIDVVYLKRRKKMHRNSP